MILRNLKLKAYILRWFLEKVGTKNSILRKYSRILGKIFKLFWSVRKPDMHVPQTENKEITAPNWVNFQAILLFKTVILKRKNDGFFCFVRENSDRGNTKRQIWVFLSFFVCFTLKWKKTRVKEEKK